MVPGGSRRGWGAADFKGLVHFLGDELVFVIGAFAIGVELLKVFGGGGFLVFSEDEGFTAEAAD